MADFGGWVDGGKNLLNKGLDKVEEGVDAGKKAVGGAVDKGAHLASGLLDRVGAHQLADQVDDFGDGVAAALGAHVDEKQLGQTELFNDLVHGNPKTIRANAQHLADFAAAFAKVGQGMRRLDSGSWKGQAAEAFRAQFALHPAKWDEASFACHDASGALVHYAGTVEWAQSKAQEAIALYRQGEQESREAVAAYNQRVDAYNDKVRAQQEPGPRPGPFSDPGLATRQRAQEVLDEARRQRGGAAAAARGMVEAALASAPAAPPPLSRLGSDYTDFMAGGAIELDHAAVGVVKGTADILNFARSLNPEDPYNLLHPAEYEKSVATTLAGLVSTAAHPERAIKGAVDDFKRDPFEFAGRLLPNAVQPEMFAGGTLRTGARFGLREGADAAIEDAARSTEAKGAGIDSQDGTRRPHEPRHSGDPDRLAAAADRSVDVSTIPGNAVWRTSDEPLWRFDARSPDAIFEEGFQPWEPSNTHLRDYVEKNTPSAYVGTTRNPDLGWAPKFRYEIDAPGGIDVNASMPDNIFASESEIAFPGGVRAENIKGVWERTPDGGWGNFTPNPNYRPPAAPPEPRVRPSGMLPPGWTL
ncbi:WXG100 family type VII secretion target [Streptomyces sp. ASQP_92]|uniref:WXG100 family type VII secretion target n=1 Tax=Streptomyces sp. ASQP_92 TaxID=2979116 RepID=UPI0021BE5BF1|nr:WXG100 family type VII secretion target [Streptomyces sp. ASQP_92]MCT9089268.1 WXG100 family type VII secretion target [Streptomyces sp. ASQP_92]